MSGLYLLDTNILSEPIRREPDPAVLEAMEAHQGKLVTASVVWHEMLFGCYRLPESAKRTAIERYLFDIVQPTFQFLHYEDRAAAWHASERARLASIGRKPPFVDGQIAAIARVNSCTLVTRNPSDFEFFEGLALGSW